MKTTSIKFNCEYCNKESYSFVSHFKFSKHHFCSIKCYSQYCDSRQQASYPAIHAWLKRKFGKATECENITKCLKTSKNYQWAKLKDKEYERKRENFWRLCVSCHSIYDGKIESDQRVNYRRKADYFEK